jgi:two-component system OmpR family sensor kinase
MKIVEDMTFNNESNEQINDRISPFNMKISEISLSDLEKNYEKVRFEYEPPIDMFIVNTKKYLHFNPTHHGPPKDMMPPQEGLFINGEKIFFKPPKPNHFDIVLIDVLNEDFIKYFWLLVLFIVDTLLIWFYFFIIKKLKPLLTLKDNMIKLSTGNFSISMKTKQKDEISQVSNEFDNAIKQLRQLRESRNLFLRNIMHELKTPITKGKLITDMYDECERKHILVRVFQRLEYLLSEFAKIEELTSGKLVLQKATYTAYDLIEQAFDILLIDEDKISLMDNYNLSLCVDFELFSIALKNLIDNAISYNTKGNPKIFIEKNLIKIVNKGEKLKKDIEEYYKPFNHEYETSTSGLGLGLYISNNIIKIHDFKLEYEYINEHHNFIIKFK